MPHQTAGSAPVSSLAGWWYPLTFWRSLQPQDKGFDNIQQLGQSLDTQFGVGALTERPNTDLHRVDSTGDPLEFSFQTSFWFLLQPNNYLISQVNTTQGWAPFHRLAHGARLITDFWIVVQLFWSKGIFQRFCSGICNIYSFQFLIAWIVFWGFHSCWIRLPLSGTLNHSLQTEGRIDTRQIWAPSFFVQRPRSQGFTRGHPDNTGGKPGPKSRRRHLICFLCLHSFFWMARHAGPFSALLLLSGILDFFLDYFLCKNVCFCCL